VTLADLRRAEDAAGTNDTLPEGRGLLGGLNAYHLRILCEPQMNGGYGFTPAEVGQMSLDQVWFLLCELKVLKSESGATEKMDSEAAAVALKSDDQGRVAGRTEDGTPIVARIRVGGKSLARRMMEERDRQRERERKKGEKAERRARREKRRMKRGGT